MEPLLRLFVVAEMVEITFLLELLAHTDPILVATIVTMGF
jgi:hypothetical protein